MNDSSLFGLKLLAGILSGVAAILAVVYIVTIVQNQPVTPTAPVSYNMFYSEKTSPTRISYYNGNHFLSYDTETQEISSLTPRLTYPIPDAIDVTWTSHGVYFRFLYPPTESNLAEIYAEKTRDTEYSITQQYWYLGYDSNSLQLSFTTDRSPYKSVISRGDTVVYSRDGSLWQVDSENTRTEIQSVTSGQGRFLSPLYVSDELMVVALHGTRESEVFSITTNPKESKSITKVATEQIRGVEFMATSEVVYTITTNTSGEQQLIATEISDNKQALLLEPFRGSMYREDQEAYVLYLGEDEIAVYSLDNAKTSKMFRFVDKGSFPGSVHCIEGSCYIVDVRGIARVLTSDSQRASDVREASRGAIEEQIDVSGVALTRDVLSRFDNSYTATIGRGDITRSYSRIQNALREKDINPYDFTFNITQGRYEQP